jgi:hypothetical protein
MTTYIFEPGSGPDTAFEIGKNKLKQFIIAKLTELSMNASWWSGTVLPAIARWDAAYAAWQDPDTRTKLITAEKNAARKALEPLLSKAIESLRSDPEVSDTDERNLDIYKEPHSSAPLPATDEQVEIDEVELNTSRRVIGKYRSKGSTTRGKPHGVASMELRHAIRDDDPEEIEDLTEVDISTRSPFLLEFKESERTKKVYMVGRWIMYNGKTGPWGDVVWSVIP